MSTLKHPHRHPRGKAQALLKQRGSTRYAAELHAYEFRLCQHLGRANGMTGFIGEAA